MILQCTQEQKDMILQWVDQNVVCTNCIFSEKCGKYRCTKDLQQHIIFDVVEKQKNPKAHLRQILSVYLSLYDKYQEHKNTHTWGYMKNLLSREVQLMGSGLTGSHLNDYAEFLRKDKYLTSEKLWDKCVAFERKHGIKEIKNGNL